MSRACFFLLCPLWLSLGLFWASSFLQNQNDGASGCPLGCWPPGRWAPPLEASSDNWLLWRKVAHFSSPCIWLSTGPNKTTRSQTCSLVMSPESRVDDNRDHQSHPCCPQVVRKGHHCSQVAWAFTLKSWVPRPTSDTMFNRVCDKGYLKHTGDRVCRRFYSISKTFKRK